MDEKYNSLIEPPGNQDSKDYKFENDSVKGYQNTDEVLMDGDVSVLEGEFLHLLETEEFGLDSEENIQKSTLKDGTADSEEDMDQLTSILAELGETELKQMGHVSDSKTRAETLEVEETEDLMQKWGLNKNVFKNSSRNSDPIGNFSDKAMKKQMKRPPDLGDRLGSHVMQVQTRDGGMLVPMNPAHFRSRARLVMHVSKPILLSAEMGDTVVEILQNMAGIGITHMTSRAMDSMPLDDIAGKTVEQISFEGMASAITKSGYSEQNALAEMPEIQRGIQLILSLCLSEGFDTFPTLLCADGCSMIDRRMAIYSYPIEIQALFFFALSCARKLLKHDVFTLGSIPDSPSVVSPPHYRTSVIDAINKAFIEIIFQNTENAIQTWHVDGYAFFVVGMDSGIWDSTMQFTYNLNDAVARSTTQVYPYSWTIVLMELDNVDMWNLRCEDGLRRYLGQELYMHVRDLGDLAQSQDPMPANELLCGSVDLDFPKENILFSPG